MKLQKLIIENIASIEKACIDFEHGPLGEDSMRTDGSREVDVAGCGVSGTL